MHFDQRDDIAAVVHLADVIVGGRKAAAVQLVDPAPPVRPQEGERIVKRVELVDRRDAHSGLGHHLLPEGAIVLEAVAKSRAADHLIALAAQIVLNDA
jgi:hypothetical protein